MLKPTDSGRRRKEAPRAFDGVKNAQNDANEAELTTTGRISGHESSERVWFVRQGENLYLLPVTGSHTEWYKNVLSTSAIRLTAGDNVYGGRAVPVTDPVQVDEVMERFRVKYGVRP